MTWSRTLQNLLDDARARADLTGTTTPDDTTFTTWANQAIAELRELIANEFEDALTVVSSNQTTTANVDTYALGATFFRLVGLDVTFDSGLTWFTMHRFNFAERNRWNRNALLRGISWSRMAIPKYRVVGNNIMFTPAPQGSFTWRYWYIPTFTPLAATSDTFDFIHSWDDWVAQRMAIRAIVKEESDPSAYLAELAQIYKRLTDGISNRDSGEPERIADVRNMLRRQTSDEDDWL